VTLFPGLAEKGGNEGRGGDKEKADKGTNSKYRVPVDRESRSFWSSLYMGKESGDNLLVGKKMSPETAKQREKSPTGGA